MNKKSFVVLILGVLSFSVLVTSVYAQEATGTATDSAAQNRIDAKQKIQNVRQQQIELREKAQQERAELRQSVKAKREELKTKIKTIRDEAKKKIVERMDTKIATVNKNVTARFSNVLVKLGELLSKIKGKTTLAKSQGIDTGALDSAIAEAENALSTAQSSVTAQAAKEYVVEVADESTLRSTVGSTVSAFRTDLKTVHQSVIDARHAVRKAASELAKIRGQMKDTIPSVTPGATDSAVAQ